MRLFVRRMCLTVFEKSIFLSEKSILLLLKKLCIEIKSIFRLVKLKPTLKTNVMRNEIHKIKFSNLKAAKNRHLRKTITSSKRILKQWKENLNNTEIPVKIKVATTYLKVKELL